VRNSLRDSRYRAVISRLVQERNALDVSQRELAARLGQSRSFVSKVEIFERRLDFVQLVDWVRALQLNERAFITQLLRDVPTPRPKK
jgi:transcriptional regulator with XRE-family HTH domain